MSRTVQLYPIGHPVTGFKQVRTNGMEKISKGNIKGIRLDIFSRVGPEWKMGHVFDKLLFKSSYKSNLNKIKYS